MRKLTTRPLWSRRSWLYDLLFGGGLLGLRSLACGIPRQVLAAPEAFLQRTSDARALALMAEAADVQFLILSGSDDGDPLNGNVPGTYDDPKILHSTQPSMAKTTFSLGGNTVTGAKVWSTFSSDVLGQTCFFHGMTNFIGHGQFNDVHKLGGTTVDNDVLASTLAKGLSKGLGTLQPEPVNLSGRSNSPEQFSFNGSPQPVFRPTSIAGLLRAPDATSLFGKSLSLRDRDLDAINAIFAARGTPAQKQLLDSWSTSQAQARSLPADAVSLLAQVQDDGVDSQLLTALVLFRLKLTPVAFVHLGFGGDNHVDSPSHDYNAGPLPTEVGETAASVASISKLFATAPSLGLGGKVSFATMNTFGRGNAFNLTGRAHNERHVVNLLIGSKVRPSLVGGVSNASGDLVGQPFDATSGRVDPGGNVPANETLAAFGKTVARAVGFGVATVDQMISAGQAVEAALKP